MTPYFKEHLGCEGSMSQHDTLTQALQEIADWNSHTTEFAVDYGSNGVRDFYRCIARAALSAEVESLRAGRAVPDGWRISVVKESLIVSSPIDGPGGITIALGKPHTPAVSVLEALCLDLLSAAPTPPQAEQPVPSDGWLEDGGLLYRLTDERNPCDRDEINVTMADGSRSIEARSRRARELLDRIRATHPAPQPDDARDAKRWLAATDDTRIEGPAVCAWRWNGVDEVYQYRRLTRHEAEEAIDAALSAHEQKGGAA